jgi:hypothetical protein
MSFNSAFDSTRKRVVPYTLDDCTDGNHIACQKGGTMGLFQGLAGNLSESSTEELTQKYGQYLVEDEQIEIGFKLIRDAMLITNKRIIDLDHQGATGKKVRIRSIGLDTICGVSAETAGGGADDSELEITYIKTPYMRANEIELETRKFEFPKKFDIAALYVKFEKIAQDNVAKLNNY